MRLLGVDFGFARIGIAIAELEFGVTTARPPMQASGTLKIDAKSLADLARQEQVDAVIVGLPLEAEGVEGKMARICRLLAGHLAESGLTVHLVDETLTSVEAEASLRAIPDGRQDSLKASQRRKLRDGESARLILERFIAASAPANPEGPNHEQKVG